MSDELPEGWCETNLEALFGFVLGGGWGKGREEKPDGWAEVGVWRGTEVRGWERDKGRRAATRFVKPTSLEKRRLQEGDLVIEVSGGGPDQPVGRSLLIDAEALA